MYGMGILKGLGVTFRHFFETYAEDIRYAGRRFFGPNSSFEKRQGVDTRGVYTVQYPEEKIAVPERFRFVPFLVVNDADHPETPGEDWCTSCGICAKVCPPQCIWIVRGEDPVTKRPVPQPEAFYIDIDICMNCGYCAEFCPFDAIKMDHDYELASYDRTTHHIHDKARLSKPFSYWMSIAPTTASEEAKDRGSWEHTDTVKEKKKSGGPAAIPFTPAANWQQIRSMLEANAPKPEPTPEPVAEASGQAAPVAEAAPAADDVDAEKAARLAKREAALARKRAAKEQGGE
ncbi:MAG: 4Fe-4S binding protein [Chloroflexi bacterium]|nr:4Fe-4S binding protein [Chloroflexota bacterium]